MAGAQGAINKIKAETSTLEGQKKEAMQGRDKLREAISTLKKQKNEASSGLKSMYGALDKINNAIAELKAHPAGADHPQVADQLGKLRAQREQVIGQIAHLKSGVKDLGKRLSEFQDRLGQLNESVEMIGSAVNARKSALTKIAGQAASQIGLNSNRELGNKKG